MQYDSKKIEAKWQRKWLAEKVYRAKDDSSKPKYYQLETFPYPSAAGIHMGHPKGYTAEDIHARYMRMRGREVLYTMGWDAFGLPTENYAIKVKKSPKEVAQANVDNFRKQVRMLGFSYDWDREINTSNPDYYKWTQWLFIQLFKKGLAYRAKAKVNWCPKDQTVLANEQVINGRCERDGELVVQKEMEQWFLRITDYAERLLEDLKGLDWPAATIKRQEDWIGRSEGASIKFQIPNSKFQIEIFTTRPDTLFGATYMVLAPEHPLIKNLESRIENLAEVKKYVEATSHKTELMRQEEAREKTGVELKGVKAINPATKEEIPVWIADYVLATYGTGAIMAVPAHDERDYEFARRYQLPVIHVVNPLSRNDIKDNIYPMFAPSQLPGETSKDTSERWLIQEFKLVKEGKRCYIGNGMLVNSGKFDGMDSEKAKWEITKFVGGTKKIQYKLRDWSVSRQRYWGVPIPMVHCRKCGIVPVPEKDLPVLLSDLENYRPHGMPPLASSKKFIETKCPKCGGEAKRDPETLDTFVDSSWYYLRYTDPHNNKEPFRKDLVKHWLPVDLYVIGAEHTVLHLLYSRFIAKFLHDEGYLGFKEPFLKLRHVGLILGVDGQKMSKSKGNVVNPDEIIAEFGADTVRLYLMFMGPFEDSHPWDPQGVLGVNRFLGRFFKHINGALSSGKDSLTPKDIKAALHRTIKKVGEDIENFRFNTAVSTLMILLNKLESSGAPLEAADLESTIKIFHPFAPHLAQELWSLWGKESFLDYEDWPKWDKKLIKEEKFVLIIQVNGKVRDGLEVPAGINEAEAGRLALGREKIKTFLGGKEPKRTIYIPGKVVNIVV